MLAFVAATFVMAGLVKGVVGLGLPTVALGLLGLFMLPAQAAALMIVPSFVTSFWQMLVGPSLRSLLRRLWAMHVGLFIGTVWGPVSIATLDVRIASAALGAALIVYAVLTLSSFRFSVSPGRERWVSPIVGLLTGAAAAATGVFVFPMVPYLQGMGLNRNELVQALGLSFTLSTMALGWRLVADGAISATSFTLGASVAVPLLAALVGMAIGQGLRGRMSETLFRRVFLIGVLLVGAFLTQKAWAQPAMATEAHKSLIVAAERGDAAGIRAALAAGAPIDARDASGRNALMVATHARQAAAVKALIEQRANIDLQDDRQDNPFLYAGAEGLLDILRLAIAAGANTRIVNRYGGTALIPAAERGHVEVVQELLTRTDVAVDHVNRLGWTALLEAIVLSNGGPRHQRIVQLLIDHRANVNIADREGVTPLQHARSRGYREIEAMLVKAGAR